MSWSSASLCIAWLVAAIPAHAQGVSGPSFSLEAATDERQRGLSWSNGDPVLRATASVPITDDLALNATAVSLRGSNRHGGADALVDVQASYVRQLGGWRLSADAVYRLFPGASGQGYAELGTTAGFLIGPASIDVFARYAPQQSAIGGDNLYVGSALALSIPGTPLTLSGHVGRSSGGVDDPMRARRLRPNGTYWDHGIALDYRRGRWLAGLRYVNSNAEDEWVDHSAAVIGSVGITF